MTKILKKVQLSAEQNTPKSADYKKGTQTNPFTQVEMATLQEEGTWNGGYVEGMGYVVPMMSVNSGSGSEQYGTIYYFDNCGYFKKTKPNNLPTDAVQINKYKYELYTSFSYSIVEREVIDTDPTIPSTPYLVISGFPYALFKFLADHSIVEWQAIYNGGAAVNDSTSCIIRTQHQGDCFVDELIPNYNSVIHSHPSSQYPSPQDIASVIVYKAANYNYFAVYCKGRLEPYNENTIVPSH
jgi:hypothetical protein